VILPFSLGAAVECAPRRRAAVTAGEDRRPAVDQS